MLRFDKVTFAWGTVTPASRARSRATFSHALTFQVSELSLGNLAIANTAASVQDMCLGTCAAQGTARPQQPPEVFVVGGIPFGARCNIKQRYSARSPTAHQTDGDGR